MNTEKFARNGKLKPLREIEVEKSKNEGEEKMATNLEIKVLKHINLILGDEVNKLREGCESFVEELDDQYLEELLSIQDPNQLIRTINLWIEEEELEESTEIADWGDWVWFKKGEWGLFKRFGELLKIKSEELKNIKLNKVVTTLAVILLVFVIYLIIMQLAENPPAWSINFQNISGGNQKEVGQEAKLIWWDWTIFQIWWESFNPKNYIHLFAMIIGIGFLINVLKDAADNPTGSNWAAVAGGLIFVFSFASMRPFMAIAITATACITQWRDRRSYQGVWVAPILLLAIALLLDKIGEDYLSWSTENFWGLLRMLFHWGYTLPAKSVGIICYPIIFGFSFWMGFSHNKNPRDSSGQAWIHLALSLYTLVSGVIPFTPYWGQFSIPGKIVDLNLTTIFVITNAFFALWLEIKELSLQAADKEVGQWVGIIVFFTYVVEVGFISFLLTTSPILKTPLFLSIVIGMIIPLLLLETVMLGKKMKGESRDNLMALRSMIEPDLAGTWRIGPIAIPNTYVGIMLLAIYIGVITVPGFAEILAKNF